MKFINTILALFAMVLFYGCMSVETVMDQRFNDTFDIEKYSKSEDIPYDFEVIGHSTLSGNYQDFTVDDMYKKAISIGQDNGADAVFISSIRVMPKGRRVAYSPTLNIINATSSASENSWGTINKDFDGGYSSIRNKNSGTVINYNRIMIVEFIKYKQDDKGNFIIPQVKNEITEQVKLSEEIKNRQNLEKLADEEITEEKSK